MKSFFFSAFDVHSEANKEFLNHLKILMSATKEQREIVLKSVPDIQRAKIRSDRDKIVKNISQKTGLTITSIADIVNFISFFLRQIEDQGLEVRRDIPESWGDDLVYLGILDSELKEDFVDFMKALKNISDTEYIPLLRQRRAEIGVLPSLSSTSTTVELRGVFDTSYISGSPIEDYLPKAMSVVPVISVAISVDIGEPSRFVFQATPEELNLFIDDLRSTIKQADALRRACKVEST
jgi:hypothetical protein